MIQNKMKMKEITLKILFMRKYISRENIISYLKTCHIYVCLNIRKNISYFLIS